MQRPSEILTPTLTTLYELLLSQSEQEANQLALILELYVTGSLRNFADKTNIRQHRINHNSGRNDKEKVSTIQRRHINISNYQSQGALNQTVRFFLSARYRFATANII